MSDYLVITFKISKEVILKEANKCNLETNCNQCKEYDSCMDYYYRMYIKDKNKLNKLFIKEEYKKYIKE